MKQLKKKALEMEVRAMEFFNEKLSKKDGMAGWDLVLTCLAGIVIIAVLMKAAQVAVPDLFNSMVDKFKSLLTV